MESIDPGRGLQHKSIVLSATFHLWRAASVLALCLEIVATRFAFGEERVIRAEGTSEVPRADFKCLSPSTGKPSGVLVLCPGQNGDGEELWTDLKWRAFAEQGHLALIVAAFASPDEELREGRGYFDASRGSGRMLEAILKEAGWEGLPLVLYGFSGGAHFAMTFAAWAPARVSAFCAYSFGWWRRPPEGLLCPAIVACGQLDGTRYGAAFEFFQIGRTMGKPWIWVSIRERNHSPCAELDDFVREFFSAILDANPKFQLVVDNVRKTAVDPRQTDSLTTSVLPSSHLLPEWRRIHQP